MQPDKDYSKELEVMLLFEEMQELNIFMEDPEKYHTFVTLQKEFEDQELLHELNQTDDPLQSQFSATNRGGSGGSS